MLHDRGELGGDGYLFECATLRTPLGNAVILPSYLVGYNPADRVILVRAELISDL